MCNVRTSYSQFVKYWRFGLLASLIDQPEAQLFDELDTEKIYLQCVHGWQERLMPTVYSCSLAGVVAN